MLRRAQGIQPTPEEAALEERQAKLNAEVKRHLTSILLEVTDGVFGESRCRACKLSGKPVVSWSEEVRATLSQPWWAAKRHTHFVVTVSWTVGSLRPWPGNKSRACADMLAPTC